MQKTTPLFTKRRSFLSDLTYKDRMIIETTVWLKYIVLRSI